MAVSKNKDRYWNDETLDLDPKRVLSAFQSANSGYTKRQSRIANELIQKDPSIAQSWGVRVANRRSRIDCNSIPIRQVETPVSQSDTNAAATPLDRIHVPAANRQLSPWLLQSAGSDKGRYSKYRR